MVSMADQMLDGALWRVTNAGLASNSYLLAVPGKAKPGDACTVIDPGLDRAALEQALQTTGWLPTSVLCTHGHFDHVGGAAWLQQHFSLPVYLSEADLKLAKSSNFMMAAFKLKSRIGLPDFTLLDTSNIATPVAIESAGRRFHFHALPGHTPGSCAIKVDTLLFSGDSLYARRTGLSKLPGEDHAQLRVSLQRLFNWIDGQVLVLPGHGGAATIDEIHSGNDALRTFMSANLQD